MFRTKVALLFGNDAQDTQRIHQGPLVSDFLRQLNHQRKIPLCFVILTQIDKGMRAVFVKLSFQRRNICPVEPLIGRPVVREDLFIVAGR